MSRDLCSGRLFKRLDDVLEKDGDFGKSPKKRLRNRLDGVGVG